MAQASQLFEPIFSPESLDSELHSVPLRNSPIAPLQYPIFIAQGAADSLVLPSMQRDFIDASCKRGARIGYLEYPGLEHMSLVGKESGVHGDLVSFTRSLLDSSGQYP